MSLPYERTPGGVERPPPRSYRPRPYSERLQQAQSLTKPVGHSPLPFYAHLLMLFGALAPLFYWFFRPLLDPFVLWEPVAPLSSGLRLTTDLALSSGFGLAYVAVTGAAAVYAAGLTTGRASFLGSVGGAIALIAGGRFTFGLLALLLIAASDREFPSQQVALYPWRRSQTGVELPVSAKPVVEYVEEEWSSRAVLRTPQTFLPGLTHWFLLVGAFVPIAYNPAIRGPLFEPFVALLWPLSSFVPATADFFVTSLVGFLWVALTGIAAVIGARFAARRRRPGAVVFGAVALIVGGRPVTGAAALVGVLSSLGEYAGGDEGADESHAPPVREGPEGAAAP